MTRPTLRTMRDNIDCIAIGKAGLAADQKLKRQVLEREFRATGDTAISAVLNRQNKSVQRHQTACRYASERMPRRPSAAKTGAPRRKDYRLPEGFNECGVNTGRSYASKAGERMEAKKAGFPDVMRHPSTIMICAVPLSGNLKTVAAQARPGLRKVFDGLSHGAQVEGMFQFDMKTAAYIASIIPADELPAELDPVERPDEVFALFHLHADISDPHLTKRQIKKLLRDAFPGSRRVCVKRVRNTWLTSDGYITGGAQGYLEYAAMDKTKIEFSKAWQTKDAILGCARLSTTWTKRNRAFSYGKALSVSGVVIDEDRVAELELMDRLEYVRENWDKLGAGEQFIHLWFSGAIQIIQSDARWQELGITTCKCFRKFLGIVKNWSREESAQDLDFFDYAKPLLE